MLSEDCQSREWRLARYFQAKSCYKLGSYLESLSSCEEILEKVDFSDEESRQEIQRVSVIWVIQTLGSDTYWKVIFKDWIVRPSSLST